MDPEALDLLAHPTVAAMAERIEQTAIAEQSST
jgi:hypothetical protein